MHLSSEIFISVVEKQTQSSVDEDTHLIPIVTKIMKYEWQGQSVDRKNSKRSSSPGFFSLVVCKVLNRKVGALTHL